MIELEMVKRMIRRGLYLALPIVAFLAIVGQLEWAVSGAIGIALTLINLWLSGRIIGGMAENRPEMLMPAGMAAFGIGLIMLTVAAVLLKQVDSLEFAVTGVTLVGVHLTLVMWEAADAFLKLPSKKNPSPSTGARS